MGAAGVAIWAIRLESLGIAFGTLAAPIYLPCFVFDGIEQVVVGSRLRRGFIARFGFGVRVGK